MLTSDSLQCTEKKETPRKYCPCLDGRPAYTVISKLTPNVTEKEKEEKKKEKKKRKRKEKKKEKNAIIKDLMKTKELKKKKKKINRQFVSHVLFLFLPDYFD